MKLAPLFATLLLSFLAPLAVADKYADTINMFKNAEQTKGFIEAAYGYAVLPTIGKAGMGVGGAYGEGRVYRRGEYVGDVQMAQLTVGWQLGGQAYSQLVCFKDKRAFDEFTSGSFEFGAQATAVALTAGATAEASSKGHGASISGGRNDARTEAAWRKGMAVFTITKGGLMYEAAIGGQKFNFQAK